MKKVLAGLICSVVLACGLAACGGGGSGAAATEFDFYSLVIPDGIAQSETAKNVFEQTDGIGSFYIGVYNSTADELLAIELADEDFVQGDSITANGFTYKCAVSERWGKAYYITDWEDGSIEVSVRDIDDPAVIQSFLDGLTPAEDAYHKWQEAD